MVEWVALGLGRGLFADDAMRVRVNSIAPRHN